MVALKALNILRDVIEPTSDSTSNIDEHDTLGSFVICSEPSILVKTKL